jgi:protein CpxP
MKKIILTLAIAVTAFTASYAQKTDKVRATPEQRAERASAQLQSKLSLTEEQKEKVYKIEVEKQKKQEAWSKEQRAEMKEKMESRKAEMKDSEEKLEKVLTADQKAKYEALKAERKDRMKDRKGRQPRQHRTTPVAAAASENS